MGRPLRQWRINARPVPAAEDLTEQDEQGDDEAVCEPVHATSRRASPTREHDDETAITAIAVLHRAVDWFADRGVTAERVGSVQLDG